MLKVKVEHNRPNALQLIEQVNRAAIKSSHYYPEYDQWFKHKFIPTPKITSLN